VAAAAAPGVTNLRVFGSVAPGQDRVDSDVDLLADLPPGMGLLGLARVQAEMESILGSPVDLVPAGDLKPGVRARVKADLVALRPTGNSSGWPTSRPRSTRSAPTCSAATCPTAWSSTRSGSACWKSAKPSRPCPTNCSTPSVHPLAPDRPHARPPGRYFDTARAILQATVDDDLPELERAIQALANTLPDDQPGEDAPSEDPRIEEPPANSTPPP
jgi:predicted nucleotidyltransferase